MRLFHFVFACYAPLGASRGESSARLWSQSVTADCVDSARAAVAAEIRAAGLIPSEAIETQRAVSGLIVEIERGI